MAFGLNLFLCRAGTYLAFFALPAMVKSFDSWSITLWLVAGICCVSLATMIGYLFVDRHGDKRGMTAIVEDEEEFNLKDVFRLPASFWVISLLCVTYYSAIFPFTAFSTDFFMERYGLSHSSASHLSGVIILFSMLSTWFFGLIIDKVGKRATIMILGSLLMLPCHVLMGYSEIEPIIPMIMLGISFSLVPAALWPALPLMVKEAQLGTAFGVIGMVQNIGLFLFPILAGTIRDTTGSYNRSMIMFSCLAGAGLIFSIWLKVLERKEGSFLDRAGS